MGYTVIMVRNVLLAGNTSCIHAIRIPHTPTIVGTAGVTEAVRASPVKLPTTATSEALESYSSMAGAATGRANRGILSQMEPCSMSSGRAPMVREMDTTMVNFTSPAARRPLPSEPAKG